MVEELRSLDPAKSEELVTQFKYLFLHAKAPDSRDTVRQHLEAAQSEDETELTSLIVDYCFEEKTSPKFTRASFRLSKPGRALDVLGAFTYDHEEDDDIAEINGLYSTLILDAALVDKATRLCVVWVRGAVGLLKREWETEGLGDGQFHTRTNEWSAGDHILRGALYLFYDYREGDRWGDDL